MAQRFMSAAAVRALTCRYSTKAAACMAIAGQMVGIMAYSATAAALLPACCCLTTALLSRCHRALSAPWAPHLLAWPRSTCLGLAACWAAAVAGPQVWWSDVAVQAGWLHVDCCAPAPSCSGEPAAAYAPMPLASIQTCTISYPADRSNVAALSSALLVCMVVPWVFCLLFFTGWCGNAAACNSCFTAALAVTAHDSSSAISLLLLWVLPLRFYTTRAVDISHTVPIAQPNFHTCSCYCSAALDVQGGPAKSVPA